MKASAENRHVYAQYTMLFTPHCLGPCLLSSFSRTMLDVRYLNGAWQKCSRTDNVKVMICHKCFYKYLLCPGSPPQHATSGGYFRELHLILYTCNADHRGQRRRTRTLRRRSKGVPKVALENLQVNSYSARVRLRIRRSDPQ